MAYTRTWNAAYEAIPSNADNITEGALRIRQLKQDIRERMEKDHYFDEAGTDADHGEHTKVTLRVGTAPAHVANKGILSAVDVSSKAELHYTDEDGDDVQLTSGGNVGNANGYITSAGAITGVSLALSGAVSAVTNVTASGTVTVTTAVATNTISERTAASGVTIDGLLVKDGALADAGVITNANLAGSITAAKLLAYTAGTNVIWMTHFGKGSLPNGLTKIAECYMPRAGTVTTRIVIQQDGTPKADARIYVNGVATGTARQTSASAGEYAWTENITVTAGQRIELYAGYANVGFVGSVNLQIGCANPMEACGYNWDSAYEHLRYFDVS